MSKKLRFIKSSLEQGLTVMLLYVAESSGSSPGRSGFFMAVNENGIFEGTIGGGIMEVKLIELAKNKLATEDLTPIVKPQFHDKIHGKDQSGMICSGAQTVVLMPLKKKDLGIINRLSKTEQSVQLSFSGKGIAILENETEAVLKIKSETEFECTGIFKPPRRIHIFGAGHVGLALSHQMEMLSFQVILYDDRPGILDLNQNSSGKEIRILDYGKLQENVNFQPEDAVVIVSFSYRGDKVILKQLYRLSFGYIGMMGSDSKIETLRAELKEEGIFDRDLAHIFTPIGLNIFSKTAEEIAVSIAAQIILETNKNLPTGRKKI